MLVEPTSAVDAHTEARIAARLADVRRGRTTLVVTASPLVLDHVDEVAFVQDGARPGPRHARRAARARRPRGRPRLPGRRRAAHGRGRRRRDHRRTTTCTRARRPARPARQDSHEAPHRRLGDGPRLHRRALPHAPPPAHAASPCCTRSRRSPAWPARGCSACSSTPSPPAPPPAYINTVIAIGVVGGARPDGAHPVRAALVDGVRRGGLRRAARGVHREGHRAAAVDRRARRHG